MKKLYIILAALTIFSSQAKGEQFPNISGEMLTEIRGDKIIEINGADPNINKTAGYLNVELKSAINFNKEWSLKNSINFLPASRRQYIYPERSRFILGSEKGINRGVNVDDSSLVVEEIKIAYENEDMKFSAGKINPTFATLYRRNKRIGYFITDFTEDYEITEQIGYSLSSILEDTEITLNNFFSDTTGLSDSGLNGRSKRNRNDNTAGNTGTLSSYSVTIEGRDFFEIDNLFYNVGYRSLGVNKDVRDLSREVGYTMNLEYLYKLGRSTFLIPLMEVVKIENFTGKLDRDAQYITTSLIFKYQGWNSSASYINRKIDNNYAAAPTNNSKDSILQFNIGYKFKNNMALDVSRAAIEEDKVKATAIGAILSYFYEF